MAYDQYQQKNSYDLEFSNLGNNLRNKELLLIAHQVNGDSARLPQKNHFGRIFIVEIDQFLVKLSF